MPPRARDNISFEFMLKMYSELVRKTIVSYSLYMKKVCRKCKIERLLVEFHKNARQQNVPCKICERQRYLDNRESRLEARKSYRVRNKDLISIKKNRAKATVEQFNKLFAEQNGCCKICNIHQSDLKRRIAVDHCHTTGKIRGLLCDRCNRAIGLLKDNIQTLRSATLYLQEAQEVEDKEPQR